MGDGIAADARHGRAVEARDLEGVALFDDLDPGELRPLPPDVVAQAVDRAVVDHRFVDDLLRQFALSSAAAGGALAAAAGSSSCGQ